MTQIRTLSQYAAFPLNLAVGVALSLWALRSGMDLAVLPTVALLATLLPVLLLERWMPRQARPRDEGERRTDFGFIALSALVDPLAHATAAGLAATLLLSHQGGPHHIQVIQALPLPLAALGALLVSELGDYWAHRWSHTHRGWWRLHAVHHAPRRMVALNNFRLHPLDLLLKVTFATVPVLLLGFHPEAVVLAAVIRSVTIAYQHADVYLRHGFLNHIFATNSVHRWHHSAAEEEANANYGSVLILFDQLFGTYRVPLESENPQLMGLFTTDRYPVHQLFRSLVAPLCWRQCVPPADTQRSP